MNKPRTICISSGKGGVGKTTLSVNLCAALADKGKKVLLIDGDLGLANVDVVLGLAVQHTIQETIEEGADPSSLMIETSAGFSVLPASSGVPELVNLSTEDEAFLTSTFDKLVSQFDYVVIDTAAGIGESVLWFNSWTDANIVVLSPDPTSMTDAYALMKVLNSRHQKNLFFLIVNGVESKKEGTLVFQNINQVVVNYLKTKSIYLGCIPKDNNVIQSIRKRSPLIEVSPDCRANLAIEEVAAKILSI